MTKTTKTGRYCFKKKLSGMVIYIELQDTATPDNPFLPGMESVNTYWVKATEEDLVDITVAAKRRRQ